MRRDSRRLHELAFPNVSRKRALNRLGELTSGGFLDRRGVELPGSPTPRSVYFLTARGRNALQLRKGSMNWGLSARQWKLGLSEPSIPHQIVTNRVCDWIGAHAMPEHLLPTVKDRYSNKPASRPDAIYQAREADGMGRRFVWLEVDLGHYNKDRIVEKALAGLNDESSRYLLFACPTPDRMAKLTATIDKALGSGVWDRVGIMTFDELRNGGVPGWPEPDPGLIPTSDFPTMLWDL